MQGCQLHGFLAKSGCFENGVVGVNLKDAGHGFYFVLSKPTTETVGV